MIRAIWTTLFLLTVVLLCSPTFAQQRKLSPVGYCFSSSLTSATGLTSFTGTACNGVTNNTLGSYYYAAVCVYNAAIVWRDDGTAPTATPGSGGEGITASGTTPTCFPYFGNFGQLQFIGTGAKPQIVTESNTEHGFGVAGNSSVLASSAWFLTEAITFASGGFAGIAIHDAYSTAGASGPNGNAYYNPIIRLVDGNYGAAPIFYGMYLFSKLGGQTIVGSAIGGNANIQAIATQRVSGKANIVIVNNDAFAPVTVTPAQSSAWTTANVLQIASPTGAGCSDTSAVIGGQAIGESGTWSGTTFSINNGQSIRLGPCEAALVSVQ